MDYNAPNTRQRIAARRQLHKGRPVAEGGSHVQPNTQRVFAEWMSSGRLFGLVLFFICMGLLAFLLTNARFSVQQISIQGNTALPDELVAELSGLRGRPIWFVDAALAESQLRENAYIESVQVQVAFPDQAQIHLVERRPEVRWQAGGVQYLVDGAGQVLGVAQEPAEADVLVIIDTSNTQLQPNNQLDTDALGLARSLALRLPVELGFTPAQIGWDFGLGVYVRSAAGQTIVFGQSERIDHKLAVLQLLLNDQTAFTYLDLRPSNPFYQNDQRQTTTAPDEP